MADVFTKSKRSEVMSRVRGRGNKATEGALVRLLRKGGITGWRRQMKLFGNPDFVFRKHRLVVFVDGCFWHGCPKHASQPTTNIDFWRLKLLRNKDRDRLVTRILKKRRWRVLRIWQHDLTRKNEKRCLIKIKQALERQVNQPARFHRG
ncbi:MAG: very short patch repair endonuclease [Nitrospiraceae bacterium]